jgi:hypothetical protein
VEAGRSQWGYSALLQLRMVCAIFDPKKGIMKNLYLLLFLILTSAALQAQNSVLVELQHLVGAETIEAGATYTSPEGHEYSPERLQYYI